MSNPTTPAPARPQPSTIDLSGIDPRHPEGETTTDLVSTTVAETAAGVTGVHHLGGLAARTLDRAQRQLLGTSRAPGVTVSQGAGTTTIDLDVVAEYPHPIAAVVEDLRAQVAHAAQQIVDGPVAVNIVVTDVHGPFDADPAVLDAIDEGGARAAELRDRVAERIDDVRADASDTAAEAAKSLQDDLGRIAKSADGKVGELREEADDTVQRLQDAARGGDVDSSAELERVRSEAHPEPTDARE